MAQQKHSAFFSYSRDDSEFVLKLATDLKAARAAVWLDQLDIKPGQHWDSAVEEALANCANMLLVLSPSSVASPNVMDEVSFALDEKKLIIPVLYRTCKIPLRLRRLQYIDMRPDYDKALKELLRLLAPDETAEAERDLLKKEQQERVAAEKEQVDRDAQSKKAAEEKAEAERLGFERARTENERREREQQERLARERVEAERAQRSEPIHTPTSLRTTEAAKGLRTKYWIAGILAIAALAFIWHKAVTGSSNTEKPPAAQTQVNPSSAGAGTTTTSAPSQEPIPTPPESKKPSPPSTTRWVQDFLDAWEGPKVSALQPFFDENVSPYFSLPSADWAAIAKDKENYFHRFQSIHYTLVGEPREKMQPGDRALVEFDTKYSNLLSSGIPLQGSSHVSVDLRLVDGYWKITGIREKVSK